jgi:hypothetical protein
MEKTDIVYITGFVSSSTNRFTYEFYNTLKYYTLYNPIIVHNIKNKLTEIFILYRCKYEEIEHKRLLALLDKVIDIQMYMTMNTSNLAISCVERLIRVNENFFESLIQTQNVYYYNMLDIYAYLNDGKKHVYDFRPWIMTEMNYKKVNEEKEYQENKIRKMKEFKEYIKKNEQKLYDVNIWTPEDMIKKADDKEIFDIEYERKRQEIEIQDFEIKLWIEESKLKDLEIVIEREKHLIMTTTSNIMNQNDKKRKRKCTQV